MTVTIKATATGSPTPTKVKGENVVNKDFFILRNRGDGSLDTGDGDNEETIWTFHFDGREGNGKYSNLDRKKKLEHAWLTLTLKPIYTAATPGFDEDAICIEPLEFIFLDKGKGGPIDFLADLPSGITNKTKPIDLLNIAPSYSSQAILDVLFRNDGFAALGGRISMRYLDDAIISGAELVLIQ